MTGGGVPPRRGRRATGRRPWERGPNAFRSVTAPGTEWSQRSRQMPMLEDLLLRFRRVWAPPGPVVGQAGVPNDLVARLDDELGELTEELAALDEEARVVVGEAEAEAARLVAAAQAAADAEARLAQSRLPEVRASGAAGRIRDRQSVVDDLMKRAAGDADDLRKRSRKRMNGMVEGVLAELFRPALEESDVHVVGGG